MNETGIIWTQTTWNAFSGCKKVSPGCKFCYASALSENKRGTPGFPQGFELTVRPHKFNEPRKVKTPSLIFVNSMSDFFLSDSELTQDERERMQTKGYGSMDQIRDQLIDMMGETPHEYQVLTKRPEEMLRYAQRRKLPGNFWAGVSLDSKNFYRNPMPPCRDCSSTIPTGANVYHRQRTERWHLVVLHNPE